MEAVYGFLLLLFLIDLLHSCGKYFWVPTQLPFSLPFFLLLSLCTLFSFFLPPFFPYFFPAPPIFKKLIDLRVCWGWQYALLTDIFAQLPLQSRMDKWWEVNGNSWIGLQEMFFKGNTSSDSLSMAFGPLPFSLNCGPVSWRCCCCLAVMGIKATLCTGNIADLQKKQDFDDFLEQLYKA